MASIPIDTLNVPALSYAVNDARSVAAALARLGYTSERIFLLLDEQATRQGIENVLYDRLRAAGTNDRLFVFFAGHGETMALPHGDTEGSLLPHDANSRNIFTTAISMSDVRRIGQRIAAKHILFAVDACYSGFTVAQARSPQRVDANYLRLIRERAGSTARRRLFRACGRGAARPLPVRRPLRQRHHARPQCPAPIRGGRLCLALHPR